MSHGGGPQVCASQAQQRPQRFRQRHREQRYKKSFVPHGKFVVRTVSLVPAASVGTTGTMSTLAAVPPVPEVQQALRELATFTPPPPHTAAAERQASPRTTPLQRPAALSSPLASLLGAESLPRTDVVRELWAYIKAEQLQSPYDGRRILCDQRFKDVFGCDEMTMFEMNRLLTHHVTTLA